MEWLARPHMQNSAGGDGVFVPAVRIPVTAGVCAIYNNLNNALKACRNNDVNWIAFAMVTTSTEKPQRN